MTYARSLSPPNHSFFLFGPRSTGKSTWLREHFPNALWKNLLLSEQYLSLHSSPELLRKEVEILAPGSWIVIDEVQRIPHLLNEVHDLISRFDERYKFAMSGSSARKLRRMDVNMLAGRAIKREMHPLNYNELKNDWNLNRLIEYGSLPPVVTKTENAKDILSSYVSTYLHQEIQQESLVNDVPGFHRFLKVMGIVNGEQLNASSIARDCGIARATVDRYLDILVDTLIAFRLPGWQPKAKVKELHSPRYYIFDCGVCRTLTGRIYGNLSDLEIGKLLETYLLHEIRSAISCQSVGGELAYWRSSEQREIDFIWHRGDQAIGIEIKSSQQWRREYASSISELISLKKLNKGYVIYGGDSSLKEGQVTGLSVNEFLKQLWGGEILNF